MYVLLSLPGGVTCLSHRPLIALRFGGLIVSLTLQTLEFLDIGDNNIPMIPPVIAELTNLTFLRLSKNPINDSPLPDQLGTTISRLASRVDFILTSHLSCPQVC